MLCDWIGIVSSQDFSHRRGGEAEIRHLFVRPHRVHVNPREMSRRATKRQSKQPYVFSFSNCAAGEAMAPTPSRSCPTLRGVAFGIPDRVHTASSTNRSFRAWAITSRFVRTRLEGTIEDRFQLQALLIPRARSTATQVSVREAGVARYPSSMSAGCPVADISAIVA